MVCPEVIRAYENQFRKEGAKMSRRKSSKILTRDPNFKCSGKAPLKM